MLVSLFPDPHLHPTLSHPLLGTAPLSMAQKQGMDAVNTAGEPICAAIQCMHKQIWIWQRNPQETASPHYCLLSDYGVCLVNSGSHLP